MKKLLYITCNSKPESMSVSKTVGREFVNRFIRDNGDYILEEIDLYSESIPEVNHKYFKGRAELVSGEEYNSLDNEDKKAVDRVNELCEQFMSADLYVVATPMWSISYPARLKRYVDCIILNNKTISISEEEVKGLLDDKERNMVYIQSSGGVYPRIFSGKFNHGVEYFHDVFKFLGVHRFEKLLVEGVDMDEVGRDKAIKNAMENMDKIIEKVAREPMFSI